MFLYVMLVKIHCYLYLPVLLLLHSAAASLSQLYLHQLRDLQLQCTSAQACHIRPLGTILKTKPAHFFSH